MNTIKKILLSSIPFLSILLTSCDRLSSVSSSLEHSEASHDSSLSLDDSSANSASEVISSEDTSSEVELPPEAARLVANSEAWGLGTTVTKYITNDCDYEWYVDQYNTGEYWYENCGPTSVEMAGRFYNRDFTHTASEARSLYWPNGGWWYDNNISASLTLFEVAYTTFTIATAKSLTTVLDEGNIALVNPTMELVKQEEDETHHSGLYYIPGTGHYLIVKGYVVVDDEMFFEIYDPWSVDMRYDDGALKGKDRYYDAKSFLNAITRWYTKAYAINKLDESNSEL